MATQMASTHSLSKIPIPTFQSNHIDLTLDDDDDETNTARTHTYSSPRVTKRLRNDQTMHPPIIDADSLSSSTPPISVSAQPTSATHGCTNAIQDAGEQLLARLSKSPFKDPNILMATNLAATHVSTLPPVNRPPFAASTSTMHNPFNSYRPTPIFGQSSMLPSTPSPFNQIGRIMGLNPQATPLVHNHPSSSEQHFPTVDKQVIDLTRSPSPPTIAFGTLPSDLHPRTPVCVGQLVAKGLVMYPIPYLELRDPATEWTTVRLHPKDKGPGRDDNNASQETINMLTPVIRWGNGETHQGDIFGFVEQKVAQVLGPMLGRGLIRLEGMIQRQASQTTIAPLMILVYTPKGNIPTISAFMQSNGILLDHPTYPFDLDKLSNRYYFNPHNPPPGGHNRTMFAINSLSSNPVSRWGPTSAPAKSVEVQRNQVDELFKSLKDGEELAETEPSTDVSTRLYPHQKKALTFLLEREREICGSDGNNSSLWQHRNNPLSKEESWFHVITQTEVYTTPQEAKGAILADDMGLGKTITCVSLIANTLSSANRFAADGTDALPPVPNGSISAGQTADRLSGAPDIPETKAISAKGKAKAAKLHDKLEAEYTRACRIKNKSRATLIICPLSTVSNWEDQLREHWCGEVMIFGGSGGAISPTPSRPNGQSLCTAGLIDEGSKAGTSLRVYVYHGNARRPDPAFLADFDVVITTYHTLASEFSKQSKSRSAADVEDEEEDPDSDGPIEVDEYGNPLIKLEKSAKAGTKRKKPSSVATTMTEIPSALQSIHWFRVVLDEAHSIKEPGTVASRASCDLMADRRLCLTGTPVQNKLDDVFALIKFLRLSPLDDKQTWTTYIGLPVRYNQTLGIVRLQTIMKCITLRRTKETTSQDGKKILSLPPRRDELRYLKFETKEQSIYDQIYTESKEEFRDLSKRNEVMKNYVGILQKILRLRQICDHYDLIQGTGLLDAHDSPTHDDNMALDLSKAEFDLTRAQAIFTLLRESAIAQCVDCGGEFCPSSDSIQGDSNEADIPLNKRIRKIKAQSSSSRGPTRSNSPAPSTRPIITRCQHLYCLECYRTNIFPGWPAAPSQQSKACPICQAPLFPADAVEVKPDAAIESTKKKSQKRERRQKGSGLDNYQPSTKIKVLIDDLLQSSRMNPHSENFNPRLADIEMIDEKGNTLEENVIKTVVFSQWTSMLDKIEEALEIARIKYDRLDGTMKREDRTRAMDSLKQNPSCEVLLVSLKAGGVGLNLTAAQRVYLMDPYWNPAVENQAVDRIHRLGQTRPVTTIKLIIENTIEARLLEVQRKKTELANMTLGQSYTKADLMQRRLEELNELFGA